MATRKEKHARALERRQRFFEELQRSNQEALRHERERRARELRQSWQDQHNKKHFKFVDECPLCADILRAQKRAEQENTAELATA
jgi:hypothetical protein